MVEKDVVGKKTRAKAPPKQKIGVDLDNTLTKNILEGSQTSLTDLSALQNFTSVTQTRENIYSIIDSMAEDTTIASVLETYAEDVCEPNDAGQIMWCEASDPNIAKMVTYLLDTMNVDKHIYNWAFSLIKYGDLYLRLFRESDYEDNIFNPEDVEKRHRLNESCKNVLNDNKELNEDVILKLYEKSDHYTHYVEKIPNPGEMFELTRHGKTMGYIKTESIISPANYSTDGYNADFYQYNLKKNSNDVQIFQATDFIHAALEDNTGRIPEEVTLFTTDEDYNSNSNGYNYTVRRGQSLLANVFKTWRELSLLKNSVLLNRLTKSSIVRLIQVEVGDMSKNQVSATLTRLKSMVEQKSALRTNEKMTEYTNPGPIENNIYIPTHGGQGAITTAEMGGDIDVKGLVDLDYWYNDLFGGLRVPKQYFGYCLGKDTPILLLNGETYKIEYLFEHKDEFIGKGILSCLPDGSLTASLIKNIWLTSEHAPLLRVWLDNGEYVDVTPDHKMMLRDGTFVAAQDLREGDSLMPYYDKVEKGRRKVLDNNDGKFHYQYHIVSSAAGDIPEKGYNIHHIDGNKMNDDFCNLTKLTVSEHWNQHKAQLHHSRHAATLHKRSLGLPASSHVGDRMINNGVDYKWLKRGECLPEGYIYGARKPSTETRSKMSASRLRVLNEHPEYKNLGGYKKGEATELTIKHLREGSVRYFDNLSEEELTLLHSQRSQRGKQYAAMLHEKHMDKLRRDNPSRIRYERSLRCPCCGRIFNKALNNTEYSDYLNKKHYYYCDKRCAKQYDKGGKLARSYLFYLEHGDLYEDARTNGVYCRRDFLLKFENLLPYISNLDEYVPEVNHRVVKVEYLSADNKVYDISVDNDCHTFALPCGIFVHNCDDNAGFDGGTSLSLMSSRYGKSIKRIQSTLCQVITDGVNLMLLDKGLDSYVNNFTIKMQSPTTQEEKDRRDNTATQLNNIQNIMQLIETDVEDPSTKLKITKALLSTVVTDAEVLSYIQATIDQLESEDVDGEDEGDLDEIDTELGGSDYEDYGDYDDTSSPSGLSEIPMEDEASSDIEVPDTDTLPTPGEVDRGLPEGSSNEGAANESLQEDLPSFSDLNIDGYRWGK